MIRHMVTRSEFLKLCELRSEGMDVRSISERLGRPYSSVRAWLKSETMALLVVRFFKDPPPAVSQRKKRAG